MDAIKRKVARIGHAARSVSEKVASADPPDGNSEKVTRVKEISSTVHHRLTSGSVSLRNGDCKRRASIRTFSKQKDVRQLDDSLQLDQRLLKHGNHILTERRSVSTFPQASRRRKRREMQWPIQTQREHSAASRNRRRSGMPSGSYVQEYIVLVWPFMLRTPSMVGITICGIDALRSNPTAKHQCYGPFDRSYRSLGRWGTLTSWCKQ
jgi:hypothetical protein